MAARAQSSYGVESQLVTPAGDSPFDDSLDALRVVPAPGNKEITLLASAARTADPTIADQDNLAARGLVLIIDVTAVAATPSVVFTIKGKDPVSGKYYTLLASAAIVGTGTTVLRVYPGLTAVNNQVASDVLPRTWTVTAVHADSDSITYSLGAILIL